MGCAVDRFSLSAYHVKVYMPETGPTPSFNVKSEGSKLNRRVFHDWGILSYKWQLSTFFVDEKFLLWTLPMTVKINVKKKIETFFISRQLEFEMFFYFFFKIILLWCDSPARYKIYIFNSSYVYFWYLRGWILSKCWFILWNRILTTLIVEDNTISKSLVIFTMFTDYQTCKFC